MLTMFPPEGGLKNAMVFRQQILRERRRRLTITAAPDSRQHGLSGRRGGRTRQKDRTVRGRVGVVVALGLVVVASAGCGGAGAGPAASPSASDQPASPPSVSPSPVPPSGSAPASRLTIVVDDGAGGTTTWTLTCEPAGGTHPDPGGACAALAENRSALRPVAKDKMCAQVYGGPERATITGTWGGEQVLATLSRVNSCETARWNALVPLLPTGGR